MVTLLDRIKSLGIYGVRGDMYLDWLTGKNYSVSKDSRRVGAGRHPETSSLLVQFEGFSCWSRIYTREHARDEYVAPQKKDVTSGLKYPRKGRPSCKDEETTAFLRAAYDLGVASERA